MLKGNRTSGVVVFRIQSRRVCPVERVLKTIQPWRLLPLSAAHVKLLTATSVSSVYGNN